MAEPIPGVLSEHDVEAIRQRFGVGEEQVRRDHVISHALAALSSIAADRLIFFGGTALSRTHLPDLRLSEDIDLIVRGPRDDTTREAQELLARGLARSLGVPRFEPALADTRHPSPLSCRSELPAFRSSC